MFYISESKMLLCVFLANFFQCILIRSISQKLPFDFHVTFYSMLMLQQIHEPNACGTERYSTTVGGSSSVLVLSTDERRQLLSDVGDLFTSTVSLKQHSTCINECHSIILGGSFMPVSNIDFGNNCLAFYKFGDRCLLNVIYDTIQKYIHLYQLYRN